MVIVQTNLAARRIVHSNRAMQYASAEHQVPLAKHGWVGSISCNGKGAATGVLRHVGFGYAAYVKKLITPLA